MANAGTSGLLAGTNIWTGVSNTFNNSIIVPTKTVGTNTQDAASCAFVLANAGSSSSLLSGTNVWTGLSNRFNNPVKFGSAGGGTDITIDGASIVSRNSGDTIFMFDNITTGILNLCNNLGTAGKITLANSLVFTQKTIRSLGPADVITLFDNLLTGTCNFCNNLAVNGVLNMGGLGLATIGGKLNIGTKRLFGHERHVIHNGASGNYSITDLGRNIDFYVIVIGTVNCSVLLPVVIAQQVVYIRNAMGAGNFNNVISATSNIIKAGGGVTNMITLTENTGVMLYCDGGSWIVMMAYP